MTFGGYDVSRYAQVGKGESDIFWAKAEGAEKYWTLGLN